jgi:hypothetical protein
MAKLTKRKIIIFFVFSLATINVNADDVGIRFNIASFGISYHIIPGNSVTGVFEILNFGLEINRFGLEFAPVRFLTLWGPEYSLFSSWSFFNLTAYRNILRFATRPTAYTDKLYFDIFNTINFIHFSANSFRWNYFTYIAGLRFGLLFAGVYNSFRVEIGYKNINRRHAFYLGVAVDIIPLILGWLSSSDDN